MIWVNNELWWDGRPSSGWIGSRRALWEINVKDTLLVRFAYDSLSDVGYLKELTPLTKCARLSILTIIRMPDTDPLANDAFANILEVIREMNFHMVYVYDPVKTAPYIGVKNLQFVLMRRSFKALTEELEEDYKTICFTSMEQYNKYNRLGLDREFLEERGIKNYLINGTNPNTGKDTFVCKPKSVRDENVILFTECLKHGNGIGMIVERLKLAGAAHITVWATRIYSSASVNVLYNAGATSVITSQFAGEDEQVESDLYKLIDIEGVL